MWLLTVINTCPMVCAPPFCFKYPYAVTHTYTPTRRALINSTHTQTNTTDVCLFNIISSIPVMYVKCTRNTWIAYRGYWLNDEINFFWAICQEEYCWFPGKRGYLFQWRKLSLNWRSFSNGCLFSIWFKFASKLPNLLSSAEENKAVIF